MQATQIRQKDGIFYFASYRAKDLLARVRFISRFYGEGEEIAPSRVSQDDDVAQFILEMNWATSSSWEMRLAAISSPSP